MELIRFVPINWQFDFESYMSDLLHRMIAHIRQTFSPTLRDRLRKQKQFYW